MSIHELTSILEDRYLPSEIVELLNNIDKDDLENYAVKNMICPKCCGNLMIHSWRESKGKYFGVPCYEEMTELICEVCDWVEE